MDRFKALKELGLKAEALYGDILRRVFRTASRGSPHLADIHGSADEIGPKATGAERYFGVI